MFNVQCTSFAKLTFYFCSGHAAPRGSRATHHEQARDHTRGAAAVQLGYEPAERAGVYGVEGRRLAHGEEAGGEKSLCSVVVVLQGAVVCT